MKLASIFLLDYPTLDKDVSEVFLGNICIFHRPVAKLSLGRKPPVTNILYESMLYGSTNGLPNRVRREKYQLWIAVVSIFLNSPPRRWLSTIPDTSLLCSQAWKTSILPYVWQMNLSCRTLSSITIRRVKPYHIIVLQCSKAERNVSVVQILYSLFNFCINL